VTYLDEEIRVSRGDRGNLFVLRMHDATKELPRKGDDDDDTRKQNGFLDGVAATRNRSVTAL
jgi:hypothetical protein